MFKFVIKKLKLFIEVKFNEEYVCIVNDVNLYCFDYIEERLKCCNIEFDFEFICFRDVFENIVFIFVKIIEVGEFLEILYFYFYNNVFK